jgi:hypothetical protein
VSFRLPEVNRFATWLWHPQRHAEVLNVLNGQGAQRP